MLWGLYSGSGSTPYRVCVDLAAGSAKCTCPSRKFPCKHAVSLQELDLPDATPPEWVQEWTTRRAARELDSSPEAVARRQRSREKTAANRALAMSSGIDGLRDWLLDVASAGIASLPGRPASWWQAFTARMIDAQVPGVAAAVGEIQEIVARAGPRWTSDVADRLGGLHLLCAVQPRSRLGVTVPEETVKAAPGVSDSWVALLRLETDDGRVRTVRQWCRGRRTGRWVVAIRHSAVGAPVPLLPHGLESTAVVHPYPDSDRVALGELEGSHDPAPVPAPESWRTALAALEPRLVADPWQRLFPLGCASVRLCAGSLVDGTGHGLPVRDDGGLDMALALTGGVPFDAWGLWDGHALRLGAVVVDGRLEVVG
ncbi:SWIM zinc finger [Lentzea fradiae]|uniref:SWIM zinc finger n=1 Tax=Lentzea fradiae TaxID=200378 RepID=A0A1G8CFT9_9PSEU|nr:SWIM zinc finger [Lentzea fradiae]